MHSRIQPVATRTFIALLMALAPLSDGPALAQVAPPRTLTLGDAVSRALAANSDIGAADAARAESENRRTAARADWYPRVELQEGWQRGNAPVFVFSSLLSQRRFTEQNFAVNSLNHPDALSNYRAAVTLSQPVFDGGRTRAATASADAAVALAEAERRQAAADVALAVTETYALALTADARARAASAAIEATTEDLARATARRDVGMATDADLLALAVHLAQVRAREIDARSEAGIARATLNRLMGEALDTPFDLMEPATAPATPAAPPALETLALAARPDVAAAARRVDLARAQQSMAKAALFPAVGFEGGYEWHGGSWTDRSSAWLVGVRAQLSISTAGADAAARRAAGSALERAERERAGVESAARLDARNASARLASAQARVEVATAVVAQARESQRIIRDRFGAGLATTTEVLRAAEALLDAESFAVGTRVDLTVASALLDRALGTTPGGRP